MGAVGLAERIRQGIESRPVIAEGVTISVTASFGVAASTPGHFIRKPKHFLRVE
jgi:PleD family two-component response regulator